MPEHPVYRALLIYAAPFHAIDWLIDRLTKCLFVVVLVALSILALPEWIAMWLNRRRT